MLVRSGYIECGSYRVEVLANSVTVIYNDGTRQSYVRYSTDLFRELYLTMGYSMLVDSYDLTDEEEAALVGDASKWLLTLKLSASDDKGNSEVKTMEFYRISSRKAYIRINGNGGFYVQSDRIEKIISDTEKFLTLQIIDPEAKH